ncbi:Adenylate and Guanylate cyclase catalytic domain-containing protein [Cladophialophora immunda]|nr:Adenylate and Guanylate cyclase catalytic domain-containing protein [Cladophialophora immunda]
MPRFGLRELRRAQTTVRSASSSSNHVLLLTPSTQRAPSTCAPSIVGTHFAPQNRPCLRISRFTTSTSLNSSDAARKPAQAAMVSSETPARGTPPPLGRIGIVFTDIVKSTNIWEKDTNAMIEAMKLHDDMIRGLTVANEGYEVKQNGDGFMIAFATATSAVQFCLDVQEKLLDEHWPKEILKLPPGQETKDPEGHVLFRGLQLRMSAHWGEPVSKWNEVIQRMDYLGPVVNRAARFIQVTEGGQIVVSEEFLLQLQSELEMAKQQNEAQEPVQAADEEGNHHSHAKNTPAVSLDLRSLRSRRDQKNLTHQQFEIRPLGDYEFQGLDDPHKLYFIVPCSLEGRVDHWHQVAHVTGVKGNVRSP